MYSRPCSRSESIYRRRRWVGEKTAIYSCFHVCQKTGDERKEQVSGPYEMAPDPHAKLH